VFLFFNCSQRAVKTALWCNFLVFSLKFGVWLASSSHVMLAEVVHSIADFANQVNLLMLSSGLLRLCLNIRDGVE
jgi:divalent metal cation (Fe/Co/Zn/Cd) transporter